MKERELNATEEKFEIKVSNGKQTITYTNSDLTNFDTDSIIESISNILKQS